MTKLDNHVRRIVFVDKEIYTKLKIIAIRKDTTTSQLIRDLISTEVRRNGRGDE